VDNIRYVYKEAAMPLPIWYREKYAHLFDV
jgi:hypothetical protein